jgi:hypothetical protein
MVRCTDGESVESQGLIRENGEVAGGVIERRVGGGG